jgi:hypothetical protein
MRSFSISARRMRSKTGLSVRNTRPCVRPPYSNETHLPIVDEVERIIIELQTNPSSSAVRETSLRGFVEASHWATPQTVRS